MDGREDSAAITKLEARDFSFVSVSVPWCTPAGSMGGGGCGPQGPQRTVWFLLRGGGFNSVSWLARLVRRALERGRGAHSCC